jgi:adenine phosphoribosyltransferase
VDLEKIIAQLIKKAGKEKFLNIDDVTPFAAPGSEDYFQIERQLLNEDIDIMEPEELEDEVEEKAVLEYGVTSLFIHEDAIKPGQRVLILDDVLATGGTSLSIAKLVERLQGKVVSFTYLINLSYLPGYQRIIDANYPVNFVVKF